MKRINKFPPSIFDCTLLMNDFNDQFRSHTAGMTQIWINVIVITFEVQAMKMEDLRISWNHDLLKGVATCVKDLNERFNCSFHIHFIIECQLLKSWNMNILGWLKNYERFFHAWLPAPVSGLRKNPMTWNLRCMFFQIWEKFLMQFRDWHSSKMCIFGPCKFQKNFSIFSSTLCIAIKCVKIQTFKKADGRKS